MGGKLSKLTNAIKEDNILLVSQILNNSDKKLFNNSAVFNEVVEMGNYDMISLFLENGVDPNISDNFHKLSPLIIAARNGDDDIISLLLEYGAIIHKTNTFADTALIYAVYNGHYDTTCLLVESGICINARNNWSISPLMFAAARGHQDIVQYLVEHGANVNDVDCYGTTALMYAAEADFDEIAKYLISQGARITHKERDKYTQPYFNKLFKMLIKRTDEN